MRNSTKILGLGPLWTQQITGSVFQISLQHDWQICYTFFNGPIMARTQILVHRWGPRTRFWHCFADGLNQSLVSFLVQATP